MGKVRNDLDESLEVNTFKRRRIKAIFNRPPCLTTSHDCPTATMECVRDALAPCTGLQCILEGRSGLFHGGENLLSDRSCDQPAKSITHNNPSHPTVGLSQCAHSTPSDHFQSKRKDVPSGQDASKLDGRTHIVFRLQHGKTGVRSSSLMEHLDGLSGCSSQLVLVQLEGCDWSPGQQLPWDCLTVHRWTVLWIGERSQRAQIARSRSPLSSTCLAEVSSPNITNLSARATFLSRSLWRLRFLTTAVLATAHASALSSTRSIHLPSVNRTNPLFQLCGRDFATSGRSGEKHSG